MIFKNKYSTAITVGMYALNGEEKENEQRNRERK